MNQCQFLGNLTRDPELKYIQSGSAIAEFAIAINEDYTNKDGEKVKSVVFLDMQAWGKTGENIAKFFKKGDPILITNAKVKVDSWDDKTTGEKRRRTLFNVMGFGFVGGGKGNSSSPKNNTQTAPVNEGEDDDEIPF